MKALLVGLGIWGTLWYERLTEHKDVRLTGAVDADKQKWKDDTGVRFFDDAEKAMDILKPDFILNATPPVAHKKINDLAFDRNIPVLSEKPIAEEHEDVLHIVNRAADGQRLMIAENYRYVPQIRKIKNCLEDSKAGVIKEVNILFQQTHHIDNYHMTMKHPMLMDVGIHHLDMLRYFTGSDAKTVNAQFRIPAGSWYNGYSNAELRILMQNGVNATYSGSLDADVIDSSWYGTWTFICENDTLRFEPEDGNVNTGLDAVLDSFLDYLHNGTMPETHISDNYKTYQIAHAAICSFSTGKDITI